MEEQADQALKNIELILNEPGSSKNSILQMRIYLSDIALWVKVNECCSLFFEDHNFQKQTFCAN